MNDYKSAMKGLLIVFLLSFVTHAYAQRGRLTSVDTVTVSGASYGSFENYAFVLNSIVIQRNELVDSPDAVLDKVFPYNIELEGRAYPGAVYFRTSNYPTPPIPYMDDPAWFINGKQVSPFDARASRAEAYTKIVKSRQDTLIDGLNYKGAIHLGTDEDFFAKRVAMSDLIEKRTGLSVEHVVVNWRNPPRPRYDDENSVGTIIRNHFSIFHIDTSRYGLFAIKVDTLNFAEGQRYVVQLLDRAYQYNARTTKWWGPEKAQLIFADPLAVDTACPCYLTDFDTVGIDKRALHDVEVRPEPYPNKEMYLKNLSTAMALPVEKAITNVTSDSITVRFMMTRSGMLAGLTSTSPHRPAHEKILAAMKKLSCAWSLGIISGRPAGTNRKLTISYSKNQDGVIQSLDHLEYRYDDMDEVGQ